MKFLLDYQIYYEWLSNGVLSSEIKNHTIIIIKSIEYSPPLLIDLFVQYNQWIKKYYNLEKIHFDNQYVFFSRRLHCNPLFCFYFHTICNSLDKVSLSLLLLTTSIHCQYSIETLLDDLRQQIFQYIQPNLYQKKLSMFRLILLCQLRIEAIDSFLKSNAIRINFLKKK
ncbi:unnamed protein product [Adineta steineri]|uniref:Uncharacterized protein n=2 Tax=Adineta steineri TaxID=433720 RepID=A0A819K0F1_9BILA|nr:unnamed protein product [Adineta steineri]